MQEIIERVLSEVEARDIKSSVISSVIVGTLSAIGGLPWWGIALTAIAAFSLMPWGFIGWRKHQQMRYQPISAKWYRVDMPALWQAACMYDDIEPYLPIREGTPCYPTLQMLKSENLAGRLDFTIEQKNMWQRVRREDLQEIARRRGDNPKCLAP